MVNADSAGKAAKDAVQDLQNAGGNAAKAAKLEADKVLGELKTATDELNQRLQGLAEHGKELALDAGRQTREQALQVQDQISTRVADKPFHALAIAAGTGLVFGWLLGRR